LQFFDAENFKKIIGCSRPLMQKKKKTQQYLKECKAMAYPPKVKPELDVLAGRPAGRAMGCILLFTTHWGDGGST
jgi:hypothetical protein